MRPLTVTEAGACRGAESRPSMAVEQEEQISEVQEILANLPENQQEAIRLRFQNDLSYREISEVMKTSIGNVGYLLHHAIKTIRDRLGAGAESVSPIRRNLS